MTDKKTYTVKGIPADHYAKLTKMVGDRQAKTGERFSLNRLFLELIARAVKGKGEEG